MHRSRIWLVSFSSECLSRELIEGSDSYMKRGAGVESLKQNQKKVKKVRGTPETSFLSYF